MLDVREGPIGKDGSVMQKRIHRVSSQLTSGATTHSPKVCQLHCKVRHIERATCVLQGSRMKFLGSGEDSKDELPVRLLRKCEPLDPSRTIDVADRLFTDF